MIKIDWGKFIYERGLFGYCVWLGDHRWDSERTKWNMIIITPERRTLCQFRKLRNKVLPVLIR